MAEMEKIADARQIIFFLGEGGEFVLHGCDSRMFRLILRIVAQ
jgi:hypothetical protein